MRHNQVVLCGILQDMPKIRKKDDKAMAQFRLVTITGRRSGGLQLSSGSYDMPLVLTTDPERVAEIEKLNIGDIVLVKGALTTSTVFKTPRCPHCGETQKIPALLSYVSPSCVAITEKGACVNKYGNLDADKAKGCLKKIKEISNFATIMGVVCRAPDMYKTVGDKKRKITSYQVAVKRKLRLIGEVEDSKVDFPWVKSYGKIGMNDARYIKKGTYIFIDGWIRARKFERTETCCNCGQDITWNDVCQEIVSYATEYIKDYNDVSKEDPTNQDTLINSVRKKIIDEGEIDEYENVDLAARQEAADKLEKLEEYLKKVDDEDSSDEEESADEKT